MAILGVTNWSVSGSSPRKLLPELAQLCVGGRSINILFDMDDPAKVKIILNIRSQCYQLAQAISHAGGKPQQIAWDRALGKGIDDALVKVSCSGFNVAEWLLQTIADSRGFLEYEKIAPLYELSKSRNFVQDTQGNYIPDLFEVEIVREAELQVVSTRLQEALKQSEQTTPLDLRISRNPEGVAVIKEEQVEVSELLAQVESEQFEVLERIFRLDGQLDGYKQQMALARKRMTKWEGVVQ